MEVTDSLDSAEVSLNPSQVNPTIAAFLHGRLTIHVIEARNVENESTSFLNKLERVVTSSADGVDPYCSVKLGYNKIMQTSVATNAPSPVWNSHMSYQVCHDFESLDFRVKAAKRPGPLSIISKVKHLSMLSVNAAAIAEQGEISGWFPLGPYRCEFDGDDANERTDSESDEDEDVSPDQEGQLGEIHIRIVFEPISAIADLQHFPVPNTYFPVRENVNVTLYQDADCPPESLPQIPFHPEYPHSRCWIEMANAIMASTEFIYITGWAVWPELVMVRTDFPGDEWNGLTLGEMLIQKAEEGVTVCVMVWDELASGRFYKGLMGTHDEEVVAYFKKTPVIAIKVGRQNQKDGPLADLNDAALFTHHQKTVIVTRLDQDTGRSRVEAWVGGLDLTDGRYDNSQHSLFRTLDGLHAPPDFWQACAPISSESGPREPWHDIHSHITGAAAWDIVANFEGRWKRQALDKLKRSLHEYSVDNFVLIEEEESICDGNWSVQVVRSINESATAFDPYGDGLIVRRTACTDQSIHNTYIHHIRSAKHFVYIENQYFLGSSHMWESGQRGGFCSNLVPIELAEKICAKIRADERFVVYINIPMYPEGPPDSVAVQEILSHQRKSIEMMASRIVRTIQETGSDTSLSDWLNVFCLVNRESEDDGQGGGGTTPMEERLSQTRRFMVYIHSKFAIFDDTVAVIGSANINSRSLDGSRDTEIAISAWQPEHMATGTTAYTGEGEDNSLPQGDVAAFRASVWSEHLGEYCEEFEDPSSTDCINKIREMAEANWLHFASDEDEAGGDMPHGHLALYPYDFDPVTGSVISKQMSFPDFENALVKGRATPGIPNLLTG